MAIPETQKAGSAKVLNFRIHPRKNNVSSSRSSNLHVQLYSIFTSLIQKIILLQIKRDFTENKNHLHSQLLDFEHTKGHKIVLLWAYPTKQITPFHNVFS